MEEEEGEKEKEVPYGWRYLSVVQCLSIIHQLVLSGVCIESTVKGWVYLLDQFEHQHRKKNFK